MYEHSDIHKQSSFSRTVATEQKMGAYYTDIGICRRIHSLFSFPAEDECYILKPSIGDARTVLAVTGTNSENLFYLTVTAGGGPDLVGSEELSDLHLQHGIAKVVTSLEQREANGSSVVVESSVNS